MSASADSARLLGVSASRIRQLRAGHSLRLSAATLRRWQDHVEQQHPIAGLWSPRRVRRGAVKFKGRSYEVPLCCAAEGQQVNVVAARNGGLLIQPITRSAEGCFLSASPMPAAGEAAA